MQDDPNTEKEELPEEGRFEMTPEEATAMGGGAGAPGSFNRKRVLITLCVAFSVVIGGGLVFNTLRPPQKTAASAESEIPASSTPTEFLSSLRDRSLRRAPEQAGQGGIQQGGERAAPEPEPLLPPALFSQPREAEPPRPAPPPQAQPAPPPPQMQQAPQSPPQPEPEPEPAYFRSSLIAPVQGNLFAQAAPPPPSSAAPMPQNAAYAASGNQTQGGQANAQAPDGAAGGAAYSGRYLGEGAVWAGTVVPGILVTAINTDLPGNVLARVTQNVFDSQTGQSLLIPQGTILIARYGSSVSYAQRRVQIVWDTMIRPDGFQADLTGANGVDRAGMSGQEAEYSENWFEYVKAAGIVTLFSVANARMTETAAKHATEASAANIAEANSSLVNQLGGNLVSRAMDIQPTLTVDNGTPVNIMLNSTLYLPPVPGYDATQKFILE